MDPWDLTWADVDPREHPFDPGEAPGVVADLGRPLEFPVKPAGRAYESTVISWSGQTGRAWADQMTRAMVGHYGDWAVAWRWAHDEGDIGGGPVYEWCCPRDSMTTKDATLLRVAAALADWRGWVEELAEQFEQFPLGQLPAEQRRSAWERGASHLVTAVVARTGAGDAWYAHCEQVLKWFLERWQVPSGTAGKLVEEAIGGRFESWVGPSDDLLGDVAGQLADSLAKLPGGGPGD